MPGDFYKKTIEKTLARLSVKVPPILYKYRSWDLDTHRRLITHQELYCADPFTLNDRGDGKNPIRWDTLTYEDYVEMNSAFVPGKENMSDGEIYERAKALTDSKQFFHPGQSPKETLPDNAPNPLIGLVSLTEKPDIELLWAHYANAQKGFVVGLDGQILYQYYQAFLEPVNYVDDYSVITGFDADSFEKKYFTKLRIWEYEMEWRFLVNKIEFKSYIKNRVLALPKEAIREVIIGSSASPETKQKIIDEVTTGLPDAAILQAEYHFNSAPHITFTKIK